MATPAQAAAATVGAGSLAAAGAYGITQAVNGSGEEQTDEPALNDVVEKNPEPRFKTLSDQGSEQYADKTLGKKDTNKPLLVDYKNAENQKWWEWAYENIFKPEKEKTQDNLDPIFKAVNKNYDPYEQNPSTKTSLNYACHKAYGLKWYDFTEENHLLNNVKLFCTKGLTAANVQEPEEEKPATPKSLSDLTDVDSTYGSKFGTKNGNKEKLIAPVGKDTENNESWWKWSYKKNFLPKKKEGGEALKDPFKKVNSAYATSAVGTDNNETALNQACDAAYKKTDNLGDIKENTKLFCSKNSSEELTTS